jgi:type I restriction enzyme S subunit
MDCANHLPGWKNIRLEEVCELRKEAIHPAEYPDMPYVGLEHIDPGNPRLKKNGIATEVNSTKSRFFVGDILYGKLRPYLDKAALAEFDGLCSTDILVLRPKELTLSEYLVNIIHKNEFLNYAINSAKGVNHPRTSWSSLSAFQFMLPPLTEQHAISRCSRHERLICMRLHWRGNARLP